MSISRDFTGSLSLTLTYGGKTKQIAIHKRNEEIGLHLVSYHGGDSLNPKRRIYSGRRNAMKQKRTIDEWRDEQGHMSYMSAYEEYIENDDFDHLLPRQRSGVKKWEKNDVVHAWNERIDDRNKKRIK